MTVARIKRTTSSESQEQKALFQWAGLAEQKYPELKLLHHIPNGGIRDIRTAVNDNITMNREWKIKMYKNDH